MTPLFQAIVKNREYAKIYAPPVYTCPIMTPLLVTILQLLQHWRHKTERSLESFPPAGPSLSRVHGLLKLGPHRAKVLQVRGHFVGDHFDHRLTPAVVGEPTYREGCCVCFVDLFGWMFLDQNC